MGESTIVSYLPFSFTVPLPSMSPANLIIKGIDEDSPLDEFAVTYIPDCTAFVYVLDGKSVRTAVRSEDIAGAIVRDYISASYAIEDDAFPGLKSLPGVHTKEELQENFGEELAALLAVHKNWYANLVRLADDIWKDPASKGNSLTISSIQRLAAKRLGLNRDWVTTARVDQVKCPACTSYVSEEALVCPTCSTVIQPEKYKEKFAAVK